MSSEELVMEDTLAEENSSGSDEEFRPARGKIDKTHTPLENPRNAVSN